MKWTLKLLAGLLFLLVAAISVMAARPGVIALTGAGMRYWPVAAALLAGGVIGVWRGAAGFYRTLEHELTHVAFGLMFFHWPQGMEVTARKGGKAALSGSGNFVISLAPYFFPLTAMLLAGIAAIAAEPWRRALGSGIAAAIGYHVVVVLGELRVGQSDVANHGKTFSFAVILGLVLPILAFLLFYAALGQPGAVDYFRAWGDTMSNMLAFIRVYEDRLR